MHVYGLLETMVASNKAYIYIYNNYEYTYVYYINE